MNRKFAINAIAIATICGAFAAFGDDTYTAVEYLESDGNQYIDTQFILNSTHAATLDFQPTVLPSVSGGSDPNGTQSLFGCRNGYDSKNIAFFIDNSGLNIDFKNSSSADYRLSSYALNTSTRYAAATAAGTRCVYNKSTGVPTAQGNLWSSAFTCSGTAYLFAVSDQSASGTPLWNKAKMKFFGGTIVASDGTLLCKFVPCLRNGVEPGVYDPVRDLFFPNIGTGSFTYGDATGVVYGAAPAPAPAATIDPANYECSMMITPAAGSVSTTLSNFPLLVRLSALRQIGFNPADCGTNGEDLRFALPDGTLLSHEIDTWSTTGESTVWVNVPTLSSATQIVAYWGVKDASAAPAVTASDTWPDFVAVYHLGEGAATAHDSSGNGYDARNAATVTAGSSPKVGGCALISNSFISDVTSLVDPTVAKPLADMSVITFSSWVAVDAVDSSSANDYAIPKNSRVELARKWATSKSGAGGFSCRYFNDYAYNGGSHTAQPFFGIFECSGEGTTSNGDYNWNTVQGAPSGTWVYLTCVVNGTTVAKYINGVLATGNDWGGSDTTNPRNANHYILGPDVAPLQFGAMDDAKGSLITGNMRARMDEMRIMSGAASAAWIAADFAQQNADTFLSYGPVQGAEAPLFVVDPIAAQTVSSPLELVAGLTPSVTVRDGTTSNLLAEGADYTVAYVGNDTVGTAYAIVTGIGTYDGYAVSVPFTISGVTIYYAVSGGNEGAGTSSVSGDGSPTGWSTTKGGLKAVNGITAANVVYYVWENRWMRTPTRNHATPPTSAIVVEPGCVWTLGDKMRDNTLTLSNVIVRAGGNINVNPISDGIGTFSNTYAGNWTMEEGASATLSALNSQEQTVKKMTLSAAVTGTGAVWMPSSSSGATYSTTLANQITGDLSGFTGDIGTWNGVAAVSLELVNAASIPGDPEPQDVAYVVVTNGATLKIDHDWVSPTNRIWILGDLGTPTINVPSGKTVTISGDLVGSAGFNKTGLGTLVLKGASPELSGTITVSGGEIRLAGKAATLSTAPRITWVEDGGTYMVASLTVYPIPDQTVYDLATLAAGVRPSVTVSNLEDMVELVAGTDYTVAYSNNTTFGQATAVVMGIGDYAGTVRDVTFSIHLVKQVAANYALAADEDWSDFESFEVVSGVVIDLKGHDLTVTGLDGAGEITDSVGGGSLIFDVPAVFTSGYAAAITGVSLTGKLKLVKTGAGVLRAAKRGQTYTGGNEILGGVLRVDVGADSAMNVVSPLGFNASGVQNHNSVYLGPNGTLDPAGTHGWGYHDLTLDGGTVSNTVAGGNITYGVFNPSTTVTADSTFVAMQNYGWTVPELDGHTIHLRVKSSTTLWIGYGTPRVQPGKIVCEGGGILRTFGQGASLDSIDLEVRSAAFDLGSGSLRVHDYYPHWSSNFGWGSSALNVLGTFTPGAGAYFYGPTMQDGSAIDLSALTGAWDSTSPLTSGGNRVTKFASGASVAILLGARTPAMDERIVSWQPEQRPASTVSFTNETYVFRVGDYGLYVDSPRVFNPTFLPDIESARLASDIDSAIQSALAVTNLATDTELVLGTDYTYSYTLDDHSCIVTITGLGDYAGASIVRKFNIGEYSFKASDYSYTMDIMPGEGKVTSTLTNFPVLVRLSASKIGASAYSKCKADELRFALLDGTFLAHEIDYWNSEGESTVWVNVPEFTSNTVIRAYWGFKSGKEPLPRPTDEAWTDYIGVWHFSEESGIVHDSSVNGYHTTNDGGTVSNVNAKVGLSRNVNKTSLNTGVFNLSSTSNKKPLSVVSKFAVTGWMLSTLDVGVGSNAKYPQMMRNKNFWSDGMGWYTGIEGSSTVFGGTGSGSTREFVTIPTIYNNWVYLTAIFDGATCSVYTNGAFAQTTPINTVKAETSYVLRFGQDLTGRIDEFRIQDGLQSADYISADYATQTDPGFLTFGEVINTCGAFMLIIR